MKKHKVAYLVTPRTRSLDDAMTRTTKPSLEELQKWCGGYIQVMSGKMNNQKFEIVMHEDGKMTDAPINPLATDLMNRAWGINILDGDTPADVVVGTVVILQGWKL